MHWLYLAIAIGFEIVGTMSMKLSDGFRHFWPSVAIFVSYGIAFAFNTLALRRLDVSVTYAIWSGVGTAAIAVIGMAWLREPVTVTKLGSLALIVMGVLGLTLGGQRA